MQILMKDVRTGKKLLFVPQLGWSGGVDDVDPQFIADVVSNGITVSRLCAPMTPILSQCH